LLLGYDFIDPLRNFSPLLGFLTSPDYGIFAGKYYDGEPAI
jgi:hypothetical protein